MNGLRFESPWWLLALLPIFWTWWREYRLRRGAAVLFSSATLLRGAPRSLRQRMGAVLRVVRLLSLCALVVALARPQRGEEEFRVRTEGIDILLCIDRSGSMNAMDFQQNGERVDRLSKVKEAFGRFVRGDGEELEGRRDDRIGLVVFGGFAESRCPLTLDHDALCEILESVHTPEPMLDERGRPLDEEFSYLEASTAIGDALALAVSRLRGAEGKSKVIVLLSDGENTAGSVDPLAAAEMAEQAGIRVHTIGVGTTGTAPFPAVDRLGRRVLQSRPVKLDEELLRHIAEKSGGRYFNVRNDDGMRQVYEEIDELEKTDVDAGVFTEYRELFAWWLLPALGGMLADWLLRATWLRRLP